VEKKKVSPLDQGKSFEKERTSIRGYSGRGGKGGFLLFPGKGGKEEH